MTAARRIHRPSLSAFYNRPVTAKGQRNVRSGSTTWGYRKVKIAPPPEAMSATAQPASKWWHLPRWNPRKPITLKITYRGGASCWYEVHSRGSVGRFEGSICLHDVLDQVYGADRRSR